MSTATLAFCAAGGNRHPSAADWASGLLAFGAGRNLALCNPQDTGNSGIHALLPGHKGTINAVKIFDGPNGRWILTGAADNTIRLWSKGTDVSTFAEVQCLGEHGGSINAIAVLPPCQMFVSASADGTVRVWDLSRGEAHLSQAIQLKSRYLPLTCALFELGNGEVILAVAGTSASVQLYFRGRGRSNFELQASLSGHEGWIRSLDFVRNRNGDILLASASQDKYIRIWRIQANAGAAPEGSLTTIRATVSPIVSLSNKSHRIGSADEKHTVTFEALLVGHEDWIYTARWAPPDPADSTPSLLSASADNSLSIWRPDDDSDIWVCRTRLGEISAQKGSTTATGSTGGFWIGLWQPDGHGLASLGRTGSWRRWEYNRAEDSWLQKVSISGHTREVQGGTWARDGSYFLSTGADQTTRMFAPWKRDKFVTWHEFARPQIHGYDLNCIASTSPNQFVSGADEKLLRVFRKPKAAGQLLSVLSAIPDSSNGELPEAANIPVLGLSNKAIALDDGPHDEEDSREVINETQEAASPAVQTRKVLVDVDHPPFEEHLARHTLWPEHEKLYGHGYEISAVAASHDGTLIATACKASSIDHAVLRLYECREWREIKAALTSHSLTVTSLSFSPDDRYLLSVSRDRGWYIFQRDESDSRTFRARYSNPKGHSRMILDCSWGPPGLEHVFATAGRDKMVKIWKLVDDQAELVRSISVDTAVTAVAFAADTVQRVTYLAYGTEDGRICVAHIDALEMEVSSTLSIDTGMSPSGAINALRWRPRQPASVDDDDDDDDDDGHNGDGLLQLVAVSDDTSLRIYAINPA